MHDSDLYLATQLQTRVVAIQFYMTVVSRLLASGYNRKQGIKLLERKNRRLRLFKLQLWINEIGCHLGMHHEDQ